MKTVSILKHTTLSLFAAVMLSPVTVFATVIGDNYIGSDSHGWGDRIGNSDFEVHSMDVSLSGTVLSVIINTNFAGKGDDKLFSDYTYNINGIGYGDLFLSNAWNPVGPAPYTSDDAGTSLTQWTYGFSLDNRWGNGGAGTLYQLNGASNNDNALLSEDFIKNTATYRDGQEVAVDLNANISAIDTGTWSITNGTSISFLIDLANTNLLSPGSSEIGLHWGMTCANDVIEAAYSVPEPGVLVLLATGLIGIFAAGRRRN